MAAFLAHFRPVTTSPSVTMSPSVTTTDDEIAAPLPPAAAPPLASPNGPREVGGRQGPEPTRYGDWELRGRCIDF